LHNMVETVNTDDEVNKRRKTNRALTLQFILHVIAVFVKD